ncbi:MAG: hypothetical protein BGO41_00385 [Clostridiales bacterium 38-18]|nr:MAG: hypothetical protein BGO41_00385 [Clostridiales bacterium 38-18]
MANTEKFEQIAKQYDQPDRIKIAEITVSEIKSILKDSKDKVLMDFGCGTGLIGLSLATEFKEVLLVDSSVNMIAVTSNKIKQLDITNAKVMNFDLEMNEVEPLKVDVIIISQVLLHIPNTQAILEKLSHFLNENGMLIIIDFEENHLVNSPLVHRGFNKANLEIQLLKNGYNSFNYKSFYSSDNLFMGQRATLFLMSAIRP